MKRFKSSLYVLLSLFIGLCGAMLFIRMGIPLPWLLGSITAIAIASRFSFLPLASPRFLSSPARAIVGITIGSAFKPEIVHNLGGYISSIMLIIPFVFVITFCGVFYYVKVLKFDVTGAYFSSIPGGLLEMVAVAESFGTNLHKVVLAQSARLLFIVFTLPFIIEYCTHISLSGRVSVTQPFMESNPYEMGLLFSVALLGWWSALKLKIPGATIIGPMLFGVFFYGFGFLSSRPPNEVICVIQLILGTGVGFVFVGVTCKEIVKVLMQTLGYFFILSAISALFIYIAQKITAFPWLSILLAFAPGGQSDMNLIAIIVGADLPYVALHHIVRVFLVISIAPLLIRFVKKE